MVLISLPTYPAKNFLIESPQVYFLVCVLIKITILVEISSWPGRRELPIKWTEADLMMARPAVRQVLPDPHYIFMHQLYMIGFFNIITHAFCNASARIGTSILSTKYENFV